MTDLSLSYSGGFWIFWPDGQRLGPFESVDLAIRVRSYVEVAEKREDLYVEHVR
jgi:hypothetical protein